MPTDPTLLHAEAPAKLNLYLHVTGRRDDGFHLLDSLVAFADVGDRIDARPSPDLTLEVAGPFAADLAAEQDNLVLRAARGLRDLLGTDKGAALTLAKQVPVSSGIGGGSADAAATLRVLSALWEMSADEDALARLALDLGADVPVCLAGRPQFMAGIGDVLTDVPPLPPVWVVLANPGVAVSTPEVFKARSGGFSDSARFDQAPATASALADVLRTRGNDLEAPACSLHPEIGVAKAALERCEGCLLSRMSGSGATCFGLFEDPGAALAAEGDLARAHPGWWVAAARLRGAGEA